MVYAERTTNYNFWNNILIGARNRSSDPVGVSPYTIACYNHYLNADTNLTTIRNNYCQGSQSAGFILPFTSCSSINETTGSYNNTAGSAHVGFIFSNYEGDKGCVAAKYARAYGCQIGVSANPNATQVQWSYLMLGDNKRGIGLRFRGQNVTRNNLLLTNTWISPISRP